MSPISAECDEIIRDFYWPECRPSEIDEVVAVKSRAIQAAAFWRDRGNGSGANVLYNLAGHLEEFLAAFSTDDADSPSHVDRMRSAMSCFARAHNMEEAHRIAKYVSEACPLDPSEIRLLSVSPNAQATSLSDMILLRDALDRQDPRSTIEVAIAISSRSSPALWLWPLARNVQRSDATPSELRRVFRLLVISNPRKWQYHIMAAQIDEAVQMLNHALYLAAAFPNEPYVLAFACHRLAEAGRASEAGTLADVGWKEATRRPIGMLDTTSDGHLVMSKGEYAFCAISFSETYRLCDRPLHSLDVLSVAVDRSPDPELLSYFAMELIRCGQVERAENALETALTFTRRSVWPDLLLGTLRLEKADYSGAIALLSKRIADLPSSSALLTPFWNNLGVAYAFLGDISSSRSAFSHVPRASSERVPQGTTALAHASITSSKHIALDGFAEIANNAVPPQYAVRVAA